MSRHANSYLLLFSHPFLVESLLYNGDARWKSPANVAALVPLVAERLDDVFGD